MATELAENAVIEIPQEVCDDVAQGITCGAFVQTMRLIKAYQEDGDLTPFKEREVQENVYNSFCLADTMEKMAKAIKTAIGGLTLDTARTDEDGKLVSSLYGLKVKNNGSTTKITDSYNLINLVSNNDNVDIEAIRKACTITLKNLAKVSGRSEDYLKKAYPQYIVSEEKAKSIVREF